MPKLSRTCEWYIDYLVLGTKSASFREVALRGATHTPIENVSIENIGPARLLRFSSRPLIQQAALVLKAFFSCECRLELILDLELLYPFLQLLVLPQHLLVLDMAYVENQSQHYSQSTCYPHS